MIIIFLCYHNYHNYQFVCHLYDNYYFCCHLYHFVECPNITFNNSWYIISIYGWSWNWNRIICQSQGGDLISIETEEEWNFINNEIQRRNTKKGYNDSWSIGLRKKAGNWTWVSGRPLTFCKWGKWKPLMANRACLIVLIVHVDGTLILVRLPKVSYLCYFYQRKIEASPKRSLLTQIPVDIFRTLYPPNEKP